GSDRGGEPGERPRDVSGGRGAQGDPGRARITSRGARAWAGSARRARTCCWPRGADRGPGQERRAGGSFRGGGPEHQAPRGGVTGAGRAAGAASLDSGDERAQTATITSAQGWNVSARRGRTCWLGAAIEGARPRRRGRGRSDGWSAVAGRRGRCSGGPRRRGG